jgi:hypothetical protein
MLVRQRRAAPRCETKLRRPISRTTARGHDLHLRFRSYEPLILLRYYRATGVDRLRHIDCRSAIRSKLQPRVNGFALECQNSEDALMDATEWFLVNESFQRLQPEGEFAESK